MAEYKWHYQSIGGVTRVNIKSGEDIAHLAELDQKLWTVLSCPVTDLDFDARTLSFLDSDGDGKIRVMEVREAVTWICSLIKNKDLLLKGGSSLPLVEIDQDIPEGKQLYNSARQILTNLGKEGDFIDVADTDDNVAIFAKTRFNGDGIITPESTDKPELKDIIAACIASIGSVTDRSGVEGVNKELVDKFFTALKQYSDWMTAAESGKDSILPYGDGTAAACDAFDAIRDKVADYFMRCKLIGFDAACADAVNLSVDKIGAIRDLNLATCSTQIAECPLARPSADGKLPFGNINPAWADQFAALKATVLDIDFKGKDSITEADWNAITAKLAPFKAWKEARQGMEVEGLGIEKVNTLLRCGSEEIMKFIEKDEALREESESIDKVNKLLHYYRDLYKFLMNFVIFRDFYDRKNDGKAIFEAGELFIDQRCCKLCIRVDDLGKHADIAGLSGMFLIYCTCTSKVKNETMNIVAVMTDGKVNNLRPGKNAIFYDRDGQDWDAVVTSIVDNPINLKQAFWAPYRKFANFCSEKINQFASSKEGNITAEMQSSVDNASLDAVKEKKQPFDIAKFAGIFAALGMAVGLLVDAVVGIFNGIFAMKFWQLIACILGIMLIISGPSCFIAWRKLRKRNLGPVLNANGWAINSIVLVNILFGKTLTSTAKYPMIKLDDPFVKKKTPAWKKWFWGAVITLVAAAAVLFFTDNLKCIGLPFHKEVPVEIQVETPEEPAAVEEVSEASEEVQEKAPDEAVQAE